MLIIGAGHLAYICLVDPHLCRGHAIQSHATRGVHDKDHKSSRLARKPLTPHIRLFYIHLHPVVLKRLSTLSGAPAHTLDNKSSFRLQIYYIKTLVTLLQRLTFLCLSPSVTALFRLTFWYGAAARRVASTASRLTLSPGSHTQPSAQSLYASRDETQILCDTQ